MTNTSPGAISALSVPVSVSTLAVGALHPLPARRARAPPSSPNGAHVAAGGDDHRRHRLEEADAATAPSPPRQRPAPPEPRRIAKLSSRTG